MSPSAVLQRRPARSPVQELPRPTPSDAPTAMRLVLTHRAEGPARPRRVPRHATSLAPNRQQGRDSSILHSFHVPPQANRCSHLLEHVQQLQDHPVLESIALESLNLSSPPEYFFSIRGVLSAYAGIHPWFDVWVPACAGTTEGAGTTKKAGPSCSLSFPPEYFFSIRGVLSAYAGIHPPRFL